MRRVWLARAGKVTLLMLALLALIRFLRRQHRAERRAEQVAHQRGGW